MNIKLVRSRLGATVGVLTLWLVMLAGAGAVSAASVTPTPVSEGNPSCGDFNAGWTELKVEDLGNGTFSDGTLTVTISNFQNSDAGTPGSFDWSSNIGVDAVFVKAGNDKHNLYVYDPESTGDTDLGPQAGEGNGLSHISFCYDVGAPPPPPPSGSQPAASESLPAPSESLPGPTGDVLPLTPAPSGQDLAAGGEDDLTPPPTDTSAVEQAQSAVAWPIVLLVIATIIVTASFLMPARRNR
jgi:hypothetical protein